MPVGTARVAATPVALVSVLLAALIPCCLTPGPDGGTLGFAIAAILSVLVSACFLVIAALDRWTDLEDRVRRGLGFGVLAAAGAVACAQALLLVHPWPGITIMTGVLCTGLLRLDGMAFAGVLGGGTLAWITTAGYALLSGAGPQGWLPVTAGVAVASVLSYAARSGRLRAQALVDAAEESVLNVEVHDVATGALNLRGLEIVAVPMIENARRQGGAVSALFVDIDGLGLVNTALGLRAGDDVIHAVADVLRSCVRSTDVVCRRGGDEFVVVGPGTGMSPLELERRVRAALVAEPPVGSDVWSPKISVGSATLVPWDEGDLDALIHRAEQDLDLRRSLRRSPAFPSGGPLSPRRDGERPVSEPGV